MDNETEEKVLSQLLDGGKEVFMDSMEAMRTFAIFARVDPDGPEIDSSLEKLGKTLGIYQEEVNKIREQLMASKK